MRASLIVVFALSACGVEHVPHAADDTRVAADTPVEHSEVEPRDTREEVSRVLAPLRAPGLCAGAPADLAGATIWVDEVGLHAAPHESASTSAPLWTAPVAAGEVPSSPVVLPPDVASGTSESTIALSVRGPDACWLRLYQRDGALRFEVRADVTRCAPPRAAGSLIAWPLGDDSAGQGAGRVDWLSRRDGRVVASLALDAAPTTPLVVMGNGAVSGGGSHWLVGTTGGLVAVAADVLAMDPRPRVVGRAELGSNPTSLLVVGDLAIVTLSGSPDLDEELGHQIAVFKVSLVEGLVTLTRQKIDLAVRGPITAHPVVFDCRGETTEPWYCPRGVEATLVAAGSGWIAGWHLPSGVSAFDRDSSLAWTGLALGRGGWVAGGGSHWIPSSDPEAPQDPEAWQVVALRPDSELAPTELASARGEGCVPSPLWDSNGDLVVPVIGPAGAFVRGVLTGIDGHLSLAHGAPRPYGDSQNACAAVDAADRCADGVPRELAAMPTDTQDLYAIAPWEGGIMAYGRRREEGVVHWLPDEGARRDLALPAMHAVERALPLGDDAVVVAHFDLPLTGAASLSAYRDDGTLLWTHPFVLDAGAIIGLVAGAEDEYLVATRAGSLSLITRIDAVTGVVEARSFLAPDDPIALARFVSDGEGGAVLVFDDAGLDVRRLDPRLGLGPGANWTPPVGDAVVIDATVDGRGELRVLVEAFSADRPRGTYLVHFDRDLRFMEARPAPIAGSFATLPDGDSLIQTEAGLARLSARGAFGLVRPPGGGLMPELHAGLNTIVADRDGFRVAFWRTHRTGRELVWGRADRLGFMACAEAGLCVGQPVTGCDTPEPCLVRGCDPSTGQCRSAGLEPSCPSSMP